MIEPGLVYSLIPARAGSKGILGKNSKILNGKPLVCHSIDFSLACSEIARTFVSTDSESIRSISLLSGAEAPFLRPSELALDDTMDFPVFKHWLDYLAASEGRLPEWVVHLRPTAPLRRRVWLVNALKIAREQLPSSVRSVSEAPASPFKMWFQGANGLQPVIPGGGGNEWHNQPRQKLPQAFWQNAVIDVLRVESLLESGSISGPFILPLHIPIAEIVDIDTLEDWANAELLMAGKKSMSLDLGQIW